MDLYKSYYYFLFLNTKKNVSKLEFHKINK